MSQSTPTAAQRAAAQMRRVKPFTRRDGSDYRKLYRAAVDFHERHNPPTLDRGYWDATAADLIETSREFGNDPFLDAMLQAAFSELEAEYKRLLESEDEL